MRPLPVPVIDSTPRIPPNDWGLGKAEFHGKDFIAFLLYDRLDQTTVRTTPLHDPTRAPLADAVTQTRNTTCYMCACRCGIRVHLRNGEVRYIEGNPDHPLNQGVICAKGSSGIMKQYSTARLTKPLMHKPGSERGDGQFIEVTWDEAFPVLEERLKKNSCHRPEEVRAFYRPRPDAGFDRSVCPPIRHPQLRSPRWILFREHGGRHDLYHRWFCGGQSSAESLLSSHRLRKDVCHGSRNHGLGPVRVKDYRSVARGTNERDEPQIS